jgi:hypothetical protein
MRHPVPMAPTNRRRGTADPLKPIREPRWLVIRNKYSQAIEYRELWAGTDLRGAIDAERSRRTTDGWHVEDIPQNCAFCFADRGSERVCIPSSASSRARPDLAAVDPIDPMRAPKPTKLGDEFGDYLLTIACRQCRHIRVDEPRTLAKLVGWEIALADLAKRLRCSSCGGKECQLDAECTAETSGKGFPIAGHSCVSRSCTALMRRKISCR